MKTEKKSHLHTLGEQELEKVTGGIYPRAQSGSGDTSWDSATGGNTPLIGQVKVTTKTCPKCGKEIPEAQFTRHILQCKASAGATE